MRPFCANTEFCNDWHSSGTTRDLTPHLEAKIELLAVLAQKAFANRRITVDEVKADLRFASSKETGGLQILHPALWR